MPSLEDNNIIAARSRTPGTWDLNLMPGDHNRPNPARRLLVSIGVTIALLVAIEIVLLIQGSQIQGTNAAMEQELETITAEIATLRPKQDEAMKVRNRLVSSQYVVDHHVRWTEVLAVVESLALPSVTFLNVVSDQSGEMTIAASAETYEDLSGQVGVFDRHPDFSDVTVSGVSVEEATAATAEAALPTTAAITFTLSMKFDPALLLTTP